MCLLTRITELKPKLPAIISWQCKQTVLNPSGLYGLSMWRHLLRRKRTRIIIRPIVGSII